MPAPKDLLDRVRQRLDESSVGISQEVMDLPAPDVADLINQLTLVEAATVLAMLPIAHAIEVCDQPTMRRRGAILERLDPERAAQVLEGLSADERTDVVQQMGEHERRRLLPKLSPPVRTEVERLLRYPDHTAGGLMTTEFVHLEPTMRVSEALRHIRSVAREKESIYACYVMEPGTGRLLGAVSLRDLVMAELERPVAEVMRRKPITVTVNEDQESVAHKIAKYDLLAVPVVDEGGHLLGIVTVDDVIDALVKETTEDVQRFGGMEALDAPYMEIGFVEMIKKRAGWLCALFLSEMLTASAMQHFADELAKAFLAVEARAGEGHFALIVGSGFAERG